MAEHESDLQTRRAPLEKALVATGTTRAQVLAAVRRVMEPFDPGI